MQPVVNLTSNVGCANYQIRSYGINGTNQSDDRTPSTRASSTRIAPYIPPKPPCQREIHRKNYEPTPSAAIYQNDPSELPIKSIQKGGGRGKHTSGGLVDGLGVRGGSG